MSSTNSMNLTTSVSRTRPLLRTIWITFLFAAVVVVIVGYAFTRPLHDFVEYWTVAHRFVAHQNPYSLGETMQAEKALGWEEPVPLIPLNPPWTLILFTPLAMFHSYEVAWLIWVVLLGSAIAVASRLLMDLYFGDLRLREISDTAVYRSLFAFSFYPVLLSLKFAQIDALLLLGLAGFLFIESKNKPALAGVLLSLTVFKPQLVYLVWIAVVLRSVHRRRWRTPAIVLCVIALLTITACAFEPQVLRHYWELVSGPYGQIYPSGSVAAVRRMFKGADTTWFQLVPLFFGLGWFAIYWRKYRNRWNWTERMPALITASLLTSPWGWLFDQTLLAVPIIAVAAHHARKDGRLSGKLVVLYTVLNIVLLLGAVVSSPWAYFPGPIVMAVLLFRNPDKQEPVLSKLAVAGVEG